MKKLRQAETLENDKRDLFRACLAQMEQFVSYAEDVAGAPKNYDLSVLTNKAKQCRAMMRRAWKVI